MLRIRPGEVTFSSAIFYFVPVLLFVLVTDMGLHKSPKKVLKAFVDVGSVMCALNAITIFMYFGKGGMNSITEIQGYSLSSNYYLLGEDNATYYFSWPVLVVLWVFYYLYQRTPWRFIWSLCYTVLICISYIYTWSIVAAAASLSTPIGLFLYHRGIRKKRKIKKRKREWNASTVFFLGCLGGVVFDALMSTLVITGYFTGFVTRVLRKSSTFSGRTLIWTRSIESIVRSPIIGYGQEKWFVSANKILTNHTHNLFLETLYRGGIIALIILVVAFFAISRNVIKERNSLYRFLELMFIAFLVYASMDFAYYRFHYIIILLLLSHPELFANYQITKVGGNTV